MTYCTRNFGRGNVRLAIEVLLADVGVDAVSAYLPLN